NIKRVLIDQNSTDNSCATVWHEDLSCSRLRRNRRNAIDFTRKVGLLVRNGYIQQDCPSFRDLRNHVQIQTESLELGRDGIVDVRLYRNLCGLLYGRRNVVLRHHFRPRYELRRTTCLCQGDDFIQKDIASRLNQEGQT